MRRRARYGEQIVEEVSRELTMQYGKGFGRTNLFNTVLFTERFPDRQIAQTLSGQLGWSHFQFGKFQAADKGQMELYLRWLDRHDRRPGEERPIGLILCAEKSADHVELLDLEASGIRVAEYLTELPPLPLLERKLHDAIAVVRHRLTGESQESRTTS